MKDLLKDGNNFLNFTELGAKYNINISFFQLLQLRQAIPGSWRSIIYNDPKNDVRIFNGSEFVRVRNIWKPIHKIRGSDIYWSFIKEPDTIVSQEKWAHDLENNDIDFKSAYRLPYQITTSTYLQTFQYKILHRILSTNRWLYVRGIVNSEACDLCGESDSILHFLVMCKFCKDF